MLVRTDLDYSMSILIKIIFTLYCSVHQFVLLDCSRDHLFSYQCVIRSAFVRHRFGTRFAPLPHNRSPTAHEVMAHFNICTEVVQVVFKSCPSALQSQLCFPNSATQGHCSDTFLRRCPTVATYTLASSHSSCRKNAHVHVHNENYFRLRYAI